MSKTATYALIESQVLGSAAAEITFSSIPNTYTDLIIVVAATSDTGGSRALYMQFNSDTGANYSQTYVNGDGTTAASGRGSNANQISELLSITPSNTAQANINIQDYSNTTTNKTVLSRGNSMNQTGAVAGLWRSTSAIASIKLYPSGGNFNTNSTFRLYGIQAGNA
jgi:hypothetical protein